MKTDTLSRRIRFAEPNPLVKRIVLQEADYLIFEAINRHGPLPTGYLYEFSKHARKDYTQHQNRLTNLYNGDEKGAYLTRPKDQWDAFEARYQHIVHGLTKRAKDALGDRLASHPPAGTPWFLHQLMQACCAASLELHAPSKGLRYVTRSEVLSHPFATGVDKHPMTLELADKKTLIPDDLFALEKDGKKRFFLAEIDRATESMEPALIDRNKLGKKTTYFGTKLRHYVEILDQELAYRKWGIRKPNILIVTTSNTRATRILNGIADLDPRYAGRFAVTVEPSFGSNWRVPKTVLTHLLDEEWFTVGGRKDITAQESKTPPPRG